MSFYKRYELDRLIADGDAKTFRATENSTGRIVLLHMFNPPGQPVLAVLKGKLGSDPAHPSPPLIELGEFAGSPYAVTEEIPGFRNIREWVATLAAVGMPTPKPAPAPVVELPPDQTPTKRPAIDNPPSQLRVPSHPGSMTAKFNSLFPDEKPVTTPRPRALNPLRQRTSRRAASSRACSEFRRPNRPRLRRRIHRNPSRASSRACSTPHLRRDRLRHPPLPAHCGRTLGSSRRFSSCRWRARAIIRPRVRSRMQPTISKRCSDPPQVLRRRRWNRKIRGCSPTCSTWARRGKRSTSKRSRPTLLAPVFPRRSRSRRPANSRADSDRPTELAPFPRPFAHAAAGAVAFGIAIFWESGAVGEALTRLIITRCAERPERIYSTDGSAAESSTRAATGSGRASEHVEKDVGAVEGC